MVVDDEEEVGSTGFDGFMVVVVDDDDVVVLFGDIELVDEDKCSSLAPVDVFIRFIF